MEYIQLKCFKEGSKLRIKILSPGYIQSANCRFPRDLRNEGYIYLVPSSDITLIYTRNKFFYNIKKHNIQIVNESIISINIKVYGDTNIENPECSICLDTKSELIIFAPCVIIVRVQIVLEN